MDKEDLSILEEVINKEIYNYIDSGYSPKCEYVVRLKNILKKLNLKEIYNFDKK